MTDKPTFSESVHGTGQKGDSPHFIISASSIPAISLSVYMTSATLSTYLTADEAALLGKTLLDAASFVHKVEQVEVLADALAGPGEKR